MSIGQPASPSVTQPDYWWYAARSELLQTVVEPRLGDPGIVLDVGSADGPSVAWMRRHGRRIALDIDIDALGPGDVCASALALPFADGTFGAVAAFDVLEHCEDEARALAELARVLRPGGRLLVSVPAYQWAWTQFDDEIGHFRRYTRSRLVRALHAGGLAVERATYLFAGTFPAFAAERLLRKSLPRRSGESARTLPEVSGTTERLLRGLCRIDHRVLRRRDLPFGSSVVAVAVR